jgi:hypothetical protein
MLANVLTGPNTNGLLLAVHVHPSNVQACHLAVLGSLCAASPKLRHIFRDWVRRGNQLVTARAHCGSWKMEVVERPPRRRGF